MRQFLLTTTAAVALPLLTRAIVCAQLSEQDLKDVLARVSSQTHREMKVSIQRRALESDDDDDMS